MSVSDSFLNQIDLFLTVIFAVTFHRQFLFLLASTGPNLDIVCLSRLVHLEGITVFLEQFSVESHDLFVVNICIGSLEVLNSILSNRLNAANGKFVKYLACTLLLLLLQTSDRLVHITSLVGLVLVSLELALALIGLLDLLVLPVLDLCFAIASEVLLGRSHGLLDILDAAHFLIELSLDLLEDADAFVFRVLCLCNLSEDLAQLVTEVDEVLMDLSNLVEGDDLRRVIVDGHDQAESVALVEEALNLVPVAIEGHHLA